MLHNDLEVWGQSIELVTEIYTATALFPVSELYGLVSQIRRASVSIPSNIAEGAARQTSKEFIQFLHIARGSAAELETLLIISQNLGFLKNADDYLEKLAIIRKRLNRLISVIGNETK